MMRGRRPETSRQVNREDVLRWGKYGRDIYKHHLQYCHGKYPKNQAMLN
jgi:hypothetical protein